MVVATEVLDVEEGEKLVVEDEASMADHVVDDVEALEDDSGTACGI